MIKTLFSLAKTLTWLIILASVPGFNSCILFDDPQPVDAKKLKVFPKVLRGMRTVDDDTLIINKKCLVVVSNDPKKIPMAELQDSEKYTIRDDQVFNLESESMHGFKFWVHEDTVVFTERQQLEVCLGDTILVENDQLVVRTYKNYIFINLHHQEGASYWELYLVDLNHHDRISVRKMSLTEGKEKLIPFLGENPGETDNSLHFTSDFTRSSITGYIESGGFTDTLFLLTGDKIIKLEDSSQ